MKNKGIFTKEWWIASGIRALKTFAQEIPVVRINIRGQAFEGSAVTTSVTLGVIS